MELPSKNTGMGCHFLFQRIFPTQGSNLCLLYCQKGPLSLFPFITQGSPGTVQSVQSLIRVRLFVTPWTAAHQASLSITNSRSLPKLMSIKSVMPSSHLHPLSSPSPPAPNPSQHQGLFQWVNSSHQVAKVLKFQLQHQSSQWTPRTDLLQDGLVGSPCSPRDCQESSPAPQFMGHVRCLQISEVLSGGKNDFNSSIWLLQL